MNNNNIVFVKNNIDAVNYIKTLDESSFEEPNYLMTMDGWHSSIHNIKAGKVLKHDDLEFITSENDCAYFKVGDLLLYIHDVTIMDGNVCEVVFYAVKMNNRKDIEIIVSSLDKSVEYPFVVNLK